MFINILRITFPSKIDSSFQVYAAHADPRRPARHFGISSLFVWEWKGKAREGEVIRFTLCRASETQWILL